MIATRLASVMLVATTALMLASCASGPSRQDHLRAGFLRLPLEQDDILEAWGRPDGTHTVRNPAADRLLAPRGLFFKEAETLEVWTYRRRCMELIFDHDRLLAWGPVAECTPQAVRQ